MTEFNKLSPEEQSDRMIQSAAESRASIAQMKRDNLDAARLDEYAADLKQCKNSFEEYWAESAIASIERDVKAGRVQVIRARSNKG